MRTRLRIITLLGVAVLAAALAVSAAAATGSTSIVFGSPGGGRAVSETSIDYAARGALTVTFHGSSAAGCAARGVCAYSGTITTRAAPGTVFILRLRRGHRTTEQIEDFAASGPQVTTTSQVRRALTGGGSASCVDSGAPPNTPADVSLRDGAVTLRLLGAGTGLLATRCAGPTDPALASMLPADTLPVSSFLRGRRTADLRRSGSFTAAGFSGTFTSTVVLTLGRPRDQLGTGANSFAPGIPVARIRTVLEPLSVIAVHGRLHVQIAGVMSPGVCSLLDSCGLDETIGLPLSARGGVGELFVQGQARLPYGRFLSALGLGHGRSTLGVAGGVSWTATHLASVTALQDGNVCRGVAPAGTGFISLTAGRRLTGGLVSDDTLRSACPGPFLGAATNEPELAEGSLPRAALRRRTFTIHLRAVRTALQDDGYVIHVGGELTVTLRRGRITQRIDREPVPLNSG